MEGDVLSEVGNMTFSSLKGAAPAAVVCAQAKLCALHHALLLAKKRQLLARLMWEGGAGEREEGRARNVAWV